MLGTTTPATWEWSMPRRAPSAVPWMLPAPQPPRGIH